MTPKMERGDSELISCLLVTWGDEGPEELHKSSQGARMIFYGAFGRRKPPVFSVFSVFRGPGPGGSDQVGGGHVNEKSSWDGPAMSSSMAAIVSCCLPCKQTRSTTLNFGVASE